MIGCKRYISSIYTDRGKCAAGRAAAVPLAAPLCVSFQHGKIQSLVESLPSEGRLQSLWPYSGGASFAGSSEAPGWKEIHRGTVMLCWWALQRGSWGTPYLAVSPSCHCVLCTETHSCTYKLFHLVSLRQDFTAGPSKDVSLYCLSSGQPHASPADERRYPPCLLWLTMEISSTGWKVGGGKACQKTQCREHNSWERAVCFVIWKSSGFSQGGIVIIYFKGCWQLHLSGWIMVILS